MILKEYKFEALILAKVAIVALLNSVMLKFQPFKNDKKGLFWLLESAENHQKSDLYVQNCADFWFCPNLKRENFNFAKVRPSEIAKMIIWTIFLV